MENYQPKPAPHFFRSFVPAFLLYVCLATLVRGEQKVIEDGATEREGVAPVRDGLPQTPGEMAAWSDPVDGLRIRLRPTQRQWKPGATPTLALDLWNDSDQGNVFRYEGGQEIECEIEVDGQWHRWVADYSIVKARGYSLKAGQARDEAIEISLTGAWVRDALRLNLTPGIHRLRVAFTPARPDPGGRRPRVVSKPVEIEIVAAEPQAGSETAGGWSDIETVMASLRSELVKISSAYPELPDADAVRITRTDVFYGLKYIRNCTYLGKRGHEDTGPHPVHLRFEVYSLSEQGDPIAYAVRKPDHTWVHLRLVGWTRVYVGRQ